MKLFLEFFILVAKLNKSFDAKNNFSPSVDELHTLILYSLSPRQLRKPRLMYRHCPQRREILLSSSEACDFCGSLLPIMSSSIDRWRFHLMIILSFGQIPILSENVFSCLLVLSSFCVYFLFVTLKYLFACQF